MSSRRQEEMRRSPPYNSYHMFGDLEDRESMMMDVDNDDTLDLLADGIHQVEAKLADADFFNSFGDDFDDTDIN